jgi:hypothetical protein
VIPCELNNLIALEELDSSKCQALKHIPNGFGTLTCLKKFDMWVCEVFEMVSYGLSNFIALEKLKSSSCLSLKHVLVGFGTLTCLKKFHIWKCGVWENFRMD